MESFYDTWDVLLVEGTRQRIKHPKYYFELSLNAHSVLFAIHPELIQVQTEPDTNTFQGIVTDCMYRGEYIEYQVKIESLTV